VKICRLFQTTFQAQGCAVFDLKDVCISIFGAKEIACMVPPKRCYSSPKLHGVTSYGLDVVISHQFIFDSDGIHRFVL